MNLTRCQICQEPGEEFCADHVACNYRARLRLGCGRKVANQLRARDRWRYPREHGGRR